MALYSSPNSQRPQRPLWLDVGLHGSHQSGRRMTKAPSGLYGAWERRRFWRKGAITVTEWWHGGARTRRAPGPVAARAAMTTEYCEEHYTRIYRDLSCPYCQERPCAES